MELSLPFNRIPYLFKEGIKLYKEGIKSYFEPIIRLTSQISYPEVKQHPELQQPLINHSQDLLKYNLNILNKAICYNQTEIIHYTYLSAEFHKRLKESFNKENKDRHEIIRNTEKLLRFINDKFFEISQMNFNYLTLFYKDRHPILPRICIKGNFKIPHKNRYYIISVVRNEKVSYSSNCEIEKNSGFYHILKTGLYYLNNDIPAAAINNNYVNPRLDPYAVKQYKNYLLGNKDSKVTSWARCWKDSSLIKDARSFYKSTLIIPMTLNRKNLSNEFVKTINLGDFDRLIFGFLCLDHVKKNYFHKDIDVPIGYIFADLLSIFLFFRLVYTDFSHTFQDIHNYLNKNKFKELLNKLEQVQRVLIDKSRIAENNIFQELSPSQKNEIVDIDAILRKVIDKTKEESRTNRST